MAHAADTVLLQPDPDKGRFTIAVPERPGVVTQGETFEEAMAMAKDAIALHVEGLTEDGLDVPIERAAPMLARVQIESPDLVQA